MPRVHRHSAPIRLAASVSVLLATAVALASMSHRGGSVRLGTQAFASGAFSIKSSRGHGAIFRASNLAPGGKVTGDVTLRNSGRATGTLVLSATGLRDTPGRAGGVLSRAVDLQVIDVSSGFDMRVYRGKLGAMRQRSLLTLNAADGRTYRFVARLPDTGTGPGDNAYQRAAVSVAYRWKLVQADDRACANVFRGGAGSTRVVGTQAGDQMFGDDGDDRVFGRHGADCLHGGDGDDRIDAGAGVDKVYGGPGADTIATRDDQPDFVDCGSGRDTALVDRHDRVRGCEIVSRSARTPSDR